MPLTNTFAPKCIIFSSQVEIAPAYILLKENTPGSQPTEIMETLFEALQWHRPLRNAPEYLHGYQSCQLY